MFKQYIYSKQTIDVIKRLSLQPTPVTSSPGLPYLIWGRLQILQILGGSGPHVTPPLGSASGWPGWTMYVLASGHICVTLFGLLLGLKSNLDAINCLCVKLIAYCGCGS